MRRATASEMLFLLPEPLCKSCGAHVPQELRDCPQCGKTFKWSLREKIARALMIPYIIKEFAKEEAARALAEFNAKRWCKRHGFQNVLPLEHPPGRTREYCTHCLAYAMAHPIQKDSSL